MSAWRESPVPSWDQALSAHRRPPKYFPNSVQTAARSQRSSSRPAAAWWRTVAGGALRTPELSRQYFKVHPALSLQGGNHVVRRQGPPDPLQLELTDRLDPDRILDLREHPWTD